MLADSLVLKDSAVADVTFSGQGITVDPKTGAVISKRTDSARSVTNPRVLTIKSSITGSGTNRVRRVSWLVSDTKLDAAGVPYTMTYQGSWVFPLNAVFSTTDLDDAICIGSDLVLSTASLAIDTTKRQALLQGQA